MAKRKLVEVLESVEPVGTVKSMETEVVLYAVIGNPQGLTEADSEEEQVQLEGAFATGVRCRVRHTRRTDGEDYTFTFKLKQEAKDGGSNVQASEENNAPVDKNFFDGFRQVAERKLTKVRYIFNSKKVRLKIPNGAGEITEIEIPNIQYEVDVYQSKYPEASTLCKIDVEVDNILNFLSKEHPEIKEFNLRLALSQLPFKPENIVLANTQDDEGQSFIKHFWDVCAETLDNHRAT